MRHNFIRCGLTGLFIEIFFTGMGALFAHDYISGPTAGRRRRGTEV